MTWALAEGREKALVIASSTADSKLVAANGDLSPRRHTYTCYPVANSNVTLPRAPKLGYSPSGASTSSLAAVENPTCVTLVTCYIEFCKLFPSIYG